MLPKAVWKGGAVVIVVVVLAFVGHDQLNALYRDRKIDENKGRIEKTEKTLQDQEKQLTTHANTLESHTERLDQHDGVIEEHGKTFVDHKKRLDDHEQAIEVTMGRMGGIERKLQEIEETQEKAGALDKEVQALGAKLHALQQELGELRAQQKRRQEVQENILERLKTLEDNPKSPGK